MDDEIPTLSTYIWEYLVLSDCVDEFEELYGPEGMWSDLFRQSTGYIKTELHRDRSQLNRFITVDYWESYGAWLDWRALFEDQFEELDRRGEQRTAQERELGRFHCASPG
jgi:heme-degrading monooxygenase HmoA